nr:MAG: RNA-dependent RNA polymerase [Riboviria sp.]
MICIVGLTLYHMNNANKSRDRSRSRRRPAQGANQRLARLEQQLASLALNTSRPRSRSRRRSASRNRPRPSRVAPSTSSGSSGGAGDCTISFSEILATISFTDAETQHSQSIEMRPGGSNNKATHLANLGKLYERMQWHSLTIEYTGTVGTTEGGTIMMGYDYDHDVPVTVDIASVGVMQPNVTCAAWDKSRIVIPVQRLAPQKWMSTEKDAEAPTGQLCLFAVGANLKGKTVGYLRAHYRVSFAGPRKA